MNQGIYSAAAAMDAAGRRLDSVANNLANASSVGFKRTSSAFSAVLASQDGPLQIQRTQQTDYSQGELLRTGNPLDVALHGEGYFGVELPDGEGYTRNGSFRLTQDGALVTEDGYPVAWERRNSAIDPLGDSILVDSSGMVTQGQAQIGRLRIANFSDPSMLAEGEGGFLRAGPGVMEVAHEAEVHQGSLEGSNVNPVDELVAMVEVQRAFGRASNAMSMIEQSYRRLARIQ